MCARPVDLPEGYKIIVSGAGGSSINVQQISRCAGTNPKIAAGIDPHPLDAGGGKSNHPTRTDKLAKDQVSVIGGRKEATAPKTIDIKDQGACGIAEVVEGDLTALNSIAAHGDVAGSGCTVNVQLRCRRRSADADVAAGVLNNRLTGRIVAEDVLHARREVDQRTAATRCQHGITG